MAKKYIISQYAESMPLSLLMSDYLEQRAGDPTNTYRALKVDLASYSKFLSEYHKRPEGTLVYCDCTKSSIENWKQRCLEDSKPRTVARRLAHVKVFFKYLSDKFFAFNPSQDIRNPKTDELNFKSLSDSEYDKLLSIIDKESVSHWFTVLLLLNTGLRRTEARDLLFKNLSDNWEWIEGVKGKGNKKRNVPLSKDFRRCILRYMDWRKQFPHSGEYPIIVSKKGAKKSDPESWKVNDKTIYRVVNRILLKVCKPELAHPHTLRHTFARRALAAVGAKTKNATKALTIVKEMLGHTSIDTTMIYLKNDKNEMKELMEDFA